MKTKGKRLDGIVITNADPRYARKLDDPQGGDTIMLMQQVREVMTVNQEMEDESNWIWLTSEQMGFPLRSEFANENHGEAGSWKQCNDPRTDQTAFFSVHIITDFIRKTKRKLYDEKLEDTLQMLDLEWSKDDDTKTQCNRLNTSPLHRGNASNKNGPAQVKRRMQWEASSKPLSVDDPLLLLERQVHAEIGINWFLDREIPKGGALQIPAPNLGEGIPLPFFQFWCGDDGFGKNSTLKWCGDRPRGGLKGVIPGLRKLALGGASWYLCV